MTEVFGCVPQTYCIGCKPPGDKENLYTLLLAALKQIIINEMRADIPRIILTNTRSVRYDLVKGPFTLQVLLVIAIVRVAKQLHTATIVTLPARSITIGNISQTYLTLKPFRFWLYWTQRSPEAESETIYQHATSGLLP